MISNLTFLFLTIMAATLKVSTTEARTLLNSEFEFDDGSSTVSKPRTKREAFDSFSKDGHCPVVPETPAIVDGHLTFLDFHWNSPKPAAHPDQNMKCPKSVREWEMLTKPNLRASCPWIYVTSAISDITTSLEIYPRYYTETKCICDDGCMTGKDRACKNLRIPKTFYKKMGCNGDNPILKKIPMGVKVGCYCSAS